MKKYKVAQCPRCGKIQITKAEKRMKCVRCKKTAKFNKVKFKGYDNFDVAQGAKKVWEEEKFGDFDLEELEKEIKSKEKKKLITGDMLIKEWDNEEDEEWNKY